MNRKIIARELGAIAVGGWFILIGAGLIWAAINDIRQDRATLAWPSTPGRVTRASHSEAPLDERREWGCKYEIRLEYEYEVGGRRYRSDGILRTRRVVCSSAATLNAMLDRYRVGNSVLVFYDPRGPEVAILEPQIQTNDYVGGSVFGGGSVVFGGVLWWWIRKSGAQLDST